METLNLTETFIIPLILAFLSFLGSYRLSMHNFRKELSLKETEDSISYINDLINAVDKELDNMSNVNPANLKISSLKMYSAVLSLVNMKHQFESYKYYLEEELSVPSNATSYVKNNFDQIAKHKAYFEKFVSGGKSMNEMNKEDEEQLKSYPLTLIEDFSELKVNLLEIKQHAIDFKYIKNK